MVGKSVKIGSVRLFHRIRSGLLVNMAFFDGLAPVTASLLLVFQRLLAAGTSNVIQNFRYDRAASASTKNFSLKESAVITLRKWIKSTRVGFIDD